jgi:hypothetical protein
VRRATVMAHGALWPGLLAGDDAAPALPPAVAGWLGNLGLLEGVPFNYLVPDDRMLPPESVRFFYLDPNWLAAARDGGLSIGRNTSFDHAHDEGVAAVAAAVAGERAAGERARRLGAEPPTEGATTAGKLQSGVLLRSSLVEGWPGLELIGFADAEAQTVVDSLHHALLSPSVMICIFAGVVERVDLVEPQEGVLFGATPGGKGGYTQTLRGGHDAARLEHGHARQRRPRDRDDRAAPARRARGHDLRGRRRLAGRVRGVPGADPAGADRCGRRGARRGPAKGARRWLTRCPGRA